MTGQPAGPPRRQQIGNAPFRLGVIARAQPRLVESLLHIDDE